MIQCLECKNGKSFSLLTESHMKHKHSMSLIQYKIKHPGAPTVSQEHLDSASHAATERYNPGEAERKRVDTQEEALNKARDFFQRIDPDGSKLCETIRRRELCLSPIDKLPEEDEENASA